VALTLTTILSLWTWAGHPVHLPVQPCYQWVVQNPPAGIVQALVSAMTSESRRVHVRQSRLRAARVPVLFPTSPSCSGAQCQWLGVALDPPYYSCQWATRILKVTPRARSEHGTLPVMAVAACRRCVPSPQARPRPLGPLGPCHAVSAWSEAPLALPGAVTTWFSGMILPASPRGPWSHCITGTGTVTAPQCPHLVPCLSTE
jgi:hypothetical protein